MALFVLRSSGNSFFQETAKKLGNKKMKKQEQSKSTNLLKFTHNRSRLDNIKKTTLQVAVKECNNENISKNLGNSRS